MMELVLFVLASIGMTFIVVDGGIASNFRIKHKDKVFNTKIISYLTFGFIPEQLEFQEIVSCKQCAGFWVGMFCACLIILPEWLIIPRIILYACAASFCSMLASSIIDYYDTVAMTIEGD